MIHGFKNMLYKIEIARKNQTTVILDIQYMTYIKKETKIEENWCWCSNEKHNKEKSIKEDNKMTKKEYKNRF